MSSPEPGGRSGTAFAARSWFHGWFSWIPLPRPAVERALPASLALADVPGAGTTHPLLAVFGEQRHPTWLAGGLVIPTGSPFQEMGFVIPFVRHGGDNGLCSYIPRMYTSYYPAAWVGRAHYGFGKESARVWRQDPFFFAAAGDGSPRAHAEVDARGPWELAERSGLETLAALRAVGTQPVLGCRAQGAVVTARFAWDFGDALVRAADACVSLADDAIPGLPGGRIADVPAGTVEIRGMVWDISWPGSGHNAA